MTKSQSEMFSVDRPKKTGASNNRHSSNQAYETPWKFIRAVEARYGPLATDLACTFENKKAPGWVTEATDSLRSDFLWHGLNGLLWLNPPFGSIAPWAEKCAMEAAKGAKIILLTPASVDANWWSNYIHGKAWVDFISPRIQFDGADDPFPKPLALSVFNIAGIGYGPWRWLK